MRYLIILLALVMLSGCGKTVEPKIHTEYRDVFVPVSNIPEPPSTDCPKDAVAAAGSPKDLSDGEVAKAYRIAILQLRDCSELRNQVIDKYREMAKKDDATINDLNTEPVDGPFGAAAPSPSMISEPVKVDNSVEAEKLNELEDEFQGLYSKEYDVDDL